jgi:hypothetical protein
MQGSYIPLARTAAERKANGDPRLSIEERYASREDYLGRVSEAAVKLAAEGYVLDADIAELLRSAARHWDYAAGREARPTGGL